MSRPLVLAISAAILTALGVQHPAPAMAQPESQHASGASDIVGMRRLTESQYRRSIADIFGPDIRVEGRFEPEVRRDGLIAIGSGQASISAAGMEQYYATASGIAAQVAGPEGRKTYLPCTPKSANKPDDKCASQIFAKYGRKLYRHPLDEAELGVLVATARKAAIDSGGFYVGIEETLVSLLTSPNFLFRIERADGPSKDGLYTLDGYSRASRLSFLFWDAPPDEELLAAAGRGDLSDPSRLHAQVMRLAASPRIRDGLGAFFDDMLQLDLFRTQTKDTQRFPKYSQVLADDARKQTIKSVLALLVDRNGDYRDLFTTRETFLTRTLAMVYKVPYTSREEWASYVFPEGSPRTGVLTQLSFLSLFSHPAVSSPTRRGVAVNEIFLCQPIPPPPPDVDFTAINEGMDRPSTVRGRLELHRTNQVCAACHAIFDPLGLPLEKFDALGQYRELEAGLPIDVTSDYYGRKFEGAAGLGEVLRENPRTTSCVVRNLYATAIGRAPAFSEQKTLEAYNRTFADQGYRVPAFMAELALSDPFFKAPAPEPAPAALASSTGQKDSRP